MTAVSLKRILCLLLLAVTMSGCATTGPSYPDPDVENPGLIVIAEPVATPPPAPPIPAPPPPAAPPPIEAPSPEPVITVETPRFDLPYWDQVDLAPALASFRRTCESFGKAVDPSQYLNPALPRYGRYIDYAPACAAAQSAIDPRAFFEVEFRPARLPGDGLLTGYYEPEVEVRLTPDARFSEPILAKPNSAATLALPRKDVTARSSRVIAYGEPIEVFFLQIQGSGRLRFPDGRVLRAAYAANNGQRYKSIGTVLIDRGELTREKASKQSIAKWMERAGPAKTRALMNENPRYIYFTEQAIAPGEGPRGAMRVPLTAMGSMAVDPRYHPYGALIWLDTTLPQMGGDYRGAPTGALVVAQDTGNAIRGAERGDLFFGSGFEAGARAGVMKHRARWSVLLPKALVTPAPIS